MNRIVLSQPSGNLWLSTAPKSTYDASHCKYSGMDGSQWVSTPRLDAISFFVLGKFALEVGAVVMMVGSTTVDSMRFVLEVHKSNFSSSPSV